jgi:hypothetical protein
VLDRLVDDLQLAVGAAFYGYLHSCFLPRTSSLQTNNQRRTLFPCG